MNRRILFNKVILFTAEAYISQSIKDGMPIDPIHRKIQNGVKAYLAVGRFNKEEAQYLHKLGEDERIKKIMATDIAFVVFALEIMKMWVEQIPKSDRKGIYLGINDNKLRIGKANYAVDMLKTKRSHPEVYTEMRELIDTTSITAKHFFAFYYEKILENK